MKEGFGAERAARSCLLLESVALRQRNARFPEVLMRSIVSIGLLVGLILACSACQSSGKGSRAPSEPFELERQCGYTECDPVMFQCNRELDLLIDQCTRTCWYSDTCNICFDAASDAHGSCDADIACSEEERSTCTRYDYIALPADPDEELLEACETYMDALNSCLDEPLDIDCSEYASVERYEQASAYRCLAGLTCDDIVDERPPCDLPPADVGLADEVCAVADVCGEPCTDTQRATIEGSGGWVRDDVRAALVSCTSAACDEVSNCIEGWMEAVDGQPD
jgi:hypothetical protein